jgi:DNA-3-methyladenine glycosylase
MAYQEIATLLSGSVTESAQRLLGCQLQSTIDGTSIQVKIVETESYDDTDAASHSFKPQTPRTKVMFGKSGHLYVYFTYGMHYCCNIVVGQVGYGAAVLIRAVEPLNDSYVQMESRRQKGGFEVSNGPAKLCQALGIDARLNGHKLSQLPLVLVPQPVVPVSQIVTTTRIGISRAKDVQWRFYIKDNPYVSVK